MCPWPYQLASSVAAAGAKASPPPVSCTQRDAVRAKRRWSKKLSLLHLPQGCPGSYDSTEDSRRWSQARATRQNGQLLCHTLLKLLLAVVAAKKVILMHSIEIERLRGPLRLISWSRVPVVLWRGPAACRRV